MAEARDQRPSISIHLNQLNSLKASTCGICNEIYKSNGIHRPQTVCKNNHIYCNNCSSRITTCPNCQEPVRYANVATNEQCNRAEDMKAKLRHKIPLYPEKALKFTSNSPDATGAYTDVFKVTWDARQVALKRPRFKAKANQALMQELKTEAAIGFHLRHPNIIRIFGIAELENGFFGIIMEWADLGTLTENMKTMTKDEKLKALLCVSKGLSYMHSNRVAHRDLKPQNILLCGEKSVAKITDFDTSKQIQTVLNCHYKIGTLKYSAPELLTRGLRYGASVDVYSLIVILYELLSGIDPFPGNTDEIRRAKLRQSAPYIPSHFSADLRGLVIECWTQDQFKRPTVTSVESALEAATIAHSQMALTIADKPKSTYSNDLDSQVKEVGPPLPERTYLNKVRKSAAPQPSRRERNDGSQKLQDIDRIVSMPGTPRPVQRFGGRSFEYPESDERWYYMGSLSGNQPTGIGQMLWKNGDVYKGHWLQGMKYGSGVLSYANGDKYSGEWQNDQRHGKGTFNFSPQSNFLSYQGEWRFGAISGRGFCVWKSGEKFDGIWEDNQRLSGVETYPKESEVDYFEGLWKDGMKHGMGKKVWKDGSVFKGFWMNGEIRGQGVWTFPQRSPKHQLEGIWAGDDINFGTLVYKNGDLYVGHIENKLRHGEGVLQEAGGNIKQGIWKRDKFRRSQANQKQTKAFTNSSWFKKPGSTKDIRVSPNVYYNIGYQNTLEN